MALSRSPPPTLLSGVDNGPLALGPGRHVDLHDICVLNDHVAGLYSLQCRRWPAPRNGRGLLSDFRRRGRAVDVAGLGEFQQTFRARIAWAPGALAWAGDLRVPFHVRESQHIQNDVAAAKPLEKEVSQGIGGFRELRERLWP